MSSNLQLVVRHHNQWHRLVNTYEAEPGMV